MKANLLGRGSILDGDLEAAMDEVDREVERLTVDGALGELRVEGGSGARAGTEALHRLLRIPERAFAWTISRVTLAADAPQIRT